jgi:hypothetical protein
MATWAQIRDVMPAALGDQRYRPVAVGALPDPTVRFPTTGDAQLDSALIGLTSTPNWQQIAVQLRQFAASNGFAGVAVRRDRFDLEVVVVQGLVGPGNGPLTLANGEYELDHAWTICRQLAKLVGQFSLSPSTKQAAETAIERLGSVVAPAPVAPGATQPAQTPVPATEGWDIDIAEIQRAGGGAGDAGPAQFRLIAAAANLALRLAVDAANAQTATGSLVLVGADGLAPDLVGRLEAISGLGHTDPFAFKAFEPSMYTVGIDGPTVQAHGHTASGSLNVGDLGKSLRYYLHM